MRASRCPIWLLLLAACGNPVAAPSTAAGPPVLPAIEHDFGVIPHGESRCHDFLLDTAALRGDWIPLHVQLDCSCGRAQLLLRAADGHERAIDGRPVLDNAPRTGEQIIARVVIDTAQREAVDLPGTTSHGHVILQPATDRTGAGRLRWPLLLRFGVEAPVTLRPFAALDFGRVPSCRIGEVVTTLGGDERHPTMQFPRVAADHAALEPVLEPADGYVVLRVRCRPHALGNHRAVVTVDTDLPSGYVVRLPVTWKVVPELEATPMAKISFRADLRREQTESEARGQFLLITDHDPARTAEFVVQALVDDAGQDAASAFAIRFEPVPGQPLQRRLCVRYVGGRPEGFRGRIVLTKPGPDSPRLPVDLVAFPTSDS
jgi:hypothetical protein